MLLPQERAAAILRRAAATAASSGGRRLLVATPAAAADLLYFHSLVLGCQSSETASGGSGTQVSRKPAPRCHICAREFSRRSKMIRHVMAVHPDDVHKVDLAEFVNQNSKRRAFNRLWDEEVET